MNVGLHSISKTGSTKLCMREGHDLDGSEPSQKLSSWFQYFTSEAGAEIQPALEVTYSFNRPGTLLSIDYSYDQSGNILQTFANYEDGWLKRTFSYDDLYRLKSEEFAFIGTTLNYTFDYSPIGNITKTSEFGDYEYKGTDLGRYENPHALTKFAGMDFSYDKRGNLTSFADWKNEFNWRNQMTKTENPLVSVSYLYDGSGARIGKTTNSPGNPEIKYHYPTDSFNIEYKAGAEKTVKHISLAGFPIITIETTKDSAGTQTKTYWNHPDHLNSFTVATDENAEDIEHLVYMAFGRSWKRPAAGAYREQRNFTGYVFDGETGYHYAEARYYDSYLGRFVSQDPAFWTPEAFLTDPQQLNSYSYARNNPLKFVDKDGQAIETFIDIPFLAYDFGNLVYQVGKSTYYLGAAGYGAIAGNQAIRDENFANFMANDSNLVSATNDFLLSVAGTAIPGVPVAGIKAFKAGKEVFENVVKHGDEAAGALNSGQKAISTVKAGDEVAGIKATKHLPDQMKERNISRSSYEDAIKNSVSITPPKIDPKTGLSSQKYIGKQATVVVNPVRKTAVTIWRTGSKLLKKLLSR